jgi:hypothetical protein
LPYKEEVGGSSPSPPTRLIACNAGRFDLFPVSLSSQTIRRATVAGKPSCLPNHVEEQGGVADEADRDTHPARRDR